MKANTISHLTALAAALVLSWGLLACGNNTNPSDCSATCCGRCSGSQVCDLGQCVECTADSHCQKLPTAAERPYCRLSDNLCVECTDKAQCASGEICDNWRCRKGGTPPTSCTGDGDCPGEVCDEGSGNCVTCRLGTCGQGGTAQCARGVSGTYWQSCASGTCTGGSCEGASNPRCGDGQINQLNEECDGNDLGGVTCATVPGHSFTGGTLKCTSSTCTFDVSQCTSETTSNDGIQRARDALNGAEPKAAKSVNIPISGAMVTYVRTDSDAPGFFIQQSKTGPAIFVNQSAGSGRPNVRDIISLTATEVVLNEVDRISAYTGYSRTSNGNSLDGWRQDLSNSQNVTDVGTYESELIEVTATLTTDFEQLGNAGAGFKKAGIKTDGYTPASPSRDFVLRIPESMAEAIKTAASALGKKVIGCDVLLTDGIYWGYRTATLHDTQISLFDDDSGRYTFDCSGAESAGGSWDAHEAWTGLTSTDSAASGTFSSQDVSGVTWSYSARTIGAKTSNMAFDRGMVLSSINPSGQHVTSSAIRGGIRNLAISFGKGSSSNNPRCIKVTVNGHTYTSESFTSGNGVTSTVFNVTGINAAGSSNPTIKLEMNTDECQTQLMIGDIKWTNY